MKNNGANMMIVVVTALTPGRRCAQVQNSDQLYQALKRLGVETQLVVYPNEHHGISLPSFERDRYERWLAWFDKYTDNAPKDEEEAE